MEITFSGKLTYKYEIFQVRHFEANLITCKFLRFIIEFLLSKVIVLFVIHITV